MTVRSIRIAWLLSVLAIDAVYVSQFHQLSRNSALFPTLVAILIGASALADLTRTVFRAFFDQRAHRYTPLHDPAGDPSNFTGDERPAADARPDTRVALGQATIGFAAAAIFVALWTPLGFILDTILVVGVVPAVIGFRVRRLPVTLAVAIVFGVGFVYLFHLAGGQPLSPGLLDISFG